MGSKGVIDPDTTEPISITINKEITLISKNTKNLYDSIKDSSLNKPGVGNLREKGKTIKLSPSRFSPNKKGMHGKYLSMGETGLLEIAPKPFDFSKPVTPNKVEGDSSVELKPEICVKPCISPGDVAMRKTDGY